MPRNTTWETTGQKLWRSPSTGRFRCFKKKFLNSSEEFCASRKNDLNLHPVFNEVKSSTMSKVCEITGKRAMFGNNVSFAINKTRRRFNVNLSKKRFYIPEEDRWVTLKVSARALKTINKKGISAVLKEAKANGVIK